jgi:hypothetical protein
MKHEEVREGERERLGTSAEPGDEGKQKRL